MLFSSNQLDFIFDIVVKNGSLLLLLPYLNVGVLGIVMERISSDYARRAK